MTGRYLDRPSRRESSGFFHLLFFVGTAIGLSALSIHLSAGAESLWYRSLIKPEYAPPKATFGTAWFTLYALIGWAYWLVWREGPSLETRFALFIFYLQFALNLGWPYIFFNTQDIGFSVVYLFGLLTLVAANIFMFFRFSVWAGLALLPYFAWGCFAIGISFNIWRMNW